MPTAKCQVLYHRAHRGAQSTATYTSRIEALIKIYSLVDCPIYSVIKHRPRQLALTNLPEQVWIARRSEHIARRCLQPNVRRQATFYETVFDTYNGVALTPNVELSVASD